jgi:hypothetical protein
MPFTVSRPGLPFNPNELSSQWFLRLIVYDCYYYEKPRMLILS